MTRHLSVFALLHDVQAPNPPQNVRGFLGSNGLTIRWTEGADNSGTYDFVTVFSDSKDVGHYGVDYIAASIGAWAVGDPRVFRLKETDLAGNESALTKPLRPRPGARRQDARRGRGRTPCARLHARDADDRAVPASPARSPGPKAWSSPRKARRSTSPSHPVLP